MDEQRAYHRLFGLLWKDFFSGLPVHVEIEKDLSFEQQRAENSVRPNESAEVPRRTTEKILQKLLVEELCKRLSPEERLEGLSPKERLKGLSTDDLLAALTPEEREALARQLRTNDSSSPPG
jgi:hypothetical protein